VTDPAPMPEGPDGVQPNHMRRILSIWIPVSVVGDILFYFLVGPHVPPGRMTSTADGAQFDFTVLFLIAFPVMAGVFVYLLYACVVWRSGRAGVPDPVGGPGARFHRGLGVGWMSGTTAVVMGVFIFGTVQLIGGAGGGGGEGPSPIWTPGSKNVLPIQVIAQQWKWTYRYPTFGGFETPQLVIPEGVAIAFHVTSLDVIHSFWAYQLGVKADANPSQDNVAFTKARQLGQFIVRCSELCGLWHGAMYNSGSVVTETQFVAWAHQTETTLAADTKLLPPFEWTYVPDANGSDGGFYPDNDDPYSKVQTYGAQPVVLGGKVAKHKTSQ
jgi:cytochrome c oxidase subunit 2